MHTPGPWHAGTDEDAHVVYAGVPIIAVADTLSDDGNAETEAANARLISAAPDLLTACQSALELIDNRGNLRFMESAALLKHAIAKAKGD